MLEELDYLEPYYCLQFSPKALAFQAEDQEVDSKVLQEIAQDLVDLV